MAKYNAADDNEVVSEQIFSLLSRKIPHHQYNNLGLKLLIPAVQLDKIQRKNSCNGEEQLFEMLLHWKHSNGRRATYKTLYAVLEECQLNDQKSEVQDMRQVQFSAERKKFFISFSLKNLERVTKLKDKIEKEGKGRCWIFTEENTGAGNVLNREIVQALDDAEIVLCMMTKDYINSKAHEEEVSLAISKGKSIIPILLEQIDWSNLRTENGDPPAMQLLLHQPLFINMYDQEKDKDEFKNLIKAIEEKSGKST